MALAFCERCIYNMPKTLLGDDRFVGFDSWDISLWAGKVIVDTAENNKDKIEEFGGIELGDR